MTKKIERLHELTMYPKDKITITINLKSDYKYKVKYEVKVMDNGCLKVEEIRPNYG